MARRRRYGSDVAGWTAGAGAEAAFADNGTARIEYLFVDLSKATLSSGPTVSLNSNLIRLGVDYKFRQRAKPEPIGGSGA